MMRLCRFQLNSSICFSVNYYCVLFYVILDYFPVGWELQLLFCMHNVLHHLVSHCGLFLGCIFKPTRQTKWREFVGAIYHFQLKDGDYFSYLYRLSPF